MKCEGRRGWTGLDCTEEAKPGVRYCGEFCGGPLCSVRGCPERYVNTGLGNGLCRTHLDEEKAKRKAG